MQAPVGVIEPMQVFNQQVAALRLRPEQGAHLVKRGGIGLPPLELGLAPDALTHLVSGTEDHTGVRLRRSCSTGSFHGRESDTKDKGKNQPKNLATLSRVR